MQLRSLVLGLALALAGLAGAPSAALASCLPPSPPDQIARADVIVYGTVTEIRQTFAAAGGVITFRPERVFKGTLTSVVEVYLGPSRGGAVTSVDYAAAERGEGHTLYLRRVDAQTYETDACSGSHRGLPTPEEEKALGAGTLVAAAGDAGIGMPPAAAALIAIMALAGVIAALALRRRAVAR